ncbi:MAG: hypothetical protein V7672_04295 [Brevundimonas sp.]|jgi:predicted transcriptional regulator|uniref:hypothetical protein n=1 Tax=Brevundimonas sp. TaxID=1871086 RepID=UPI00300338B2
MASLTLKLSDDTLRKLIEAAREAGVPPERMAEIALEAWALSLDRLAVARGLAEPGRAWADASPDQGESAQQTTPEDYEGPFVDLDEALDGFSTELHRRLKR